jgi:hypothetical protein
VLADVMIDPQERVGRRSERAGFAFFRDRYAKALTQ